jgi:hypothetical protein
MMGVIMTNLDRALVVVGGAAMVGGGALTLSGSRWGVLAAAAGVGLVSFLVAMRRFG